MSLQSTASKSLLLVGAPDPKTGLSPGGCARPFSEGIETSNEAPGEAARYGSALHELLFLGLGGGLSKELAGTIAVKWGLDFDANDELLPHAERVVALLNEWMSGANTWGAVFRIVGAEKHLAVKVSLKNGHRAREAAFDEETHTYELASREMGATYDLLLELTSRQLGPSYVVLDYKTGSGDHEDYTRPSLLPQMRTLALGTEAQAVAVLHAPRTAQPIIYAEEIPQTVLSHHARMLVRARRRIGDGSMRPDGYCKYCPAKNGCPAFDGELLQSGAAIIQVIAKPSSVEMPRDPGAAHFYLGEIDKLVKRWREAIKADVKAGALYQRPQDGKFLTLRPVAGYETLSKTGLERTLGKARAAKELARLRKMGALEWSEPRENLVAVEDK